MDIYIMNIYYEYYFILKLIGSNSEIQLIQNIFGIIKDKDNKLKNNQKIWKKI